MQHCDVAMVTQAATKWLRRRLYIQHGYVGQRDEQRPGWDGAHSKRFYYTAQNSTQFKTYKLLISGILHIICSNHRWLRVTETGKQNSGWGGTPMYIITADRWVSRQRLLWALTAHNLSLQKSTLSFSWIVCAGKFYLCNKILDFFGVITMSIYSDLLLYHSIWHTAGSQQACSIC